MSNIYRNDAGNSWLEDGEPISASRVEVELAHLSKEAAKKAVWQTIAVVALAAIVLVVVFRMTSVGSGTWNLGRTVFNADLNFGTALLIAGAFAVAVFVTIKGLWPSVWTFIKIPFIVLGEVWHNLTSTKPRAKTPEGGVE